MIVLQRVYEQGPTQGARFLVDRLWPRGVRRADLKDVGWLRELGPSTGLRRWYGHEPARWEEFRRRYTQELDARPEAWQPLLEAARRGDVTLMYGARDVERNNAVVLKEYLDRALRPGPRSGKARRRALPKKPLIRR